MLYLYFQPVCHDTFHNLDATFDIWKLKWSSTIKFRIIARALIKTLIFWSIFLENFVPFLILVVAVVLRTFQFHGKVWTVINWKNSAIMFTLKSSFMEYIVWIPLKFQTSRSCTQTDFKSRFFESFILLFIPLEKFRTF